VRSLLGGVAEALRNDAPMPLVRQSVGGGGLIAQLFGGSNRGSVEAQLKAMGSVGTLFGIVDRTSTACSLVDWHLYRKNTDGRKRYGPQEDNRVEVTQHLALDIWNHPNDFTTRQELVEAGQQHIDLTGEGWMVISYLDAAHKIPGEIWGPIRPDKMAPVEHPTKFISGYVYRGPDGEQVPLDIDEVIFIRRPNPLDMYRGMGPVQAVLTDLDATKYSAEWNRNFFLNSAEPGGLIEVDATLDDTEFQDMRRRWNEQHKGVGKAHRVAILEHGKWVDRAFSQRDMQFAQLRTVSRDTIMEAFGFPKSMLGVTEDVNRANAVTGKAMFAEDLTIPRLERWKLALNNDFLPRFGATGKGLEFDYDSPIPEFAEEENARLTAQTTAYKTLIDAGVDPDDAAEVCELPKMGNTPRPQITLVPTPPPAADPTAEPPAPPEPPNPPAPAAQAHRLEIVVSQGLVDDTPRVSNHGRWTASALRAEADSPGRSVDLAPVAKALDKSLTQLLKDWSGVQADQIDSLVEQVQSIVAEDNLAGLPDMTVPTDDAHATLEAAMVAIGAEAADRVVDEADDQDVEIQPAPPAHDTLSKAAAVIAALLARNLITSAATEALRQAGRGAEAAAVAEAVRAHLDSLTDAQPRLQLGAALHRAQHAGRVSTFAAAEHTVTGAVTYYANEVNDSNTCGPCAGEDGKTLGHKVADAEDDYPTGGYVECEGRLRCRGHVVAVWTIEGES